MVHNHILEGDLLLLLKKEVLGPLEDSKFVRYKSEGYGYGNSASSSALTNTSINNNRNRINDCISRRTADRQLSSYSTATSSSQQHLVETALLSCLEFLEAQLEKLQNNDKSTDHKKSHSFSVDQIKHNGHQVSFYTGFPSFAVFWNFTSFLGLQLINIFLSLFSHISNQARSQGGSVG